MKPFKVVHIIICDVNYHCKDEADAKILKAWLSEKLNTPQGNISFTKIQKYEPK